MVKYTIEKKPHHNAIEWIATVFSICGALMVALQHFQGYYIWVTANVLWVIFAYKYRHYGLLTLSISYLVINIIGIIKWELGIHILS